MTVKVAEVVLTDQYNIITTCHQHFSIVSLSMLTLACISKQCCSKEKPQRTASLAVDACLNSEHFNTSCFGLSLSFVDIFCVPMTDNKT